MTGGVYKARECIHRGILITIIAIPTSWSRVADSNPDYDALYEVRLLQVASLVCAIVARV